MAETVVTHDNEVNEDIVIKDNLQVSSIMTINTNKSFSEKNQFCFEFYIVQTLTSVESTRKFVDRLK